MMHITEMSTQLYGGIYEFDSIWHHLGISYHITVICEVTKTRGSKSLPPIKKLKVRYGSDMKYNNMDLPKDTPMHINDRGYITKEQCRSLIRTHILSEV